ncbi:asparagine synthase (glutamine-hydrolyzing) [Acidovorax sp. SUPP3334]|uniref:asparagine synthase (glutamine-hydrolyzing) n=1 Tax=Acidovorax sp. SUPP3334 TaxID=2920881 RepID=UPI0023DE21F5|nr:asparagine synthase (glutamine-hydrolyzing) [Acidovorax sp. SUPP3334]GKT21344.1 asparagine synthase (glutamine-hydrolyzing) [Acidovorax sp. SUPP3334]
MCGIFGVLQKQASTSQLISDVEIGLERIRHRGPDGSGVWASTSGKAGLGHVRLSIIDVEAGAQPMHSRDGRFTIVFNGEIYNYIELREELGTDCFSTHSDTEVILEAYRKWGIACTTRLRGMFAFAIWDAKDKKLFIARDRFGIKPLYWTQQGDKFLFASEAKALLPFISRRELSSSAISDYFTFQFCLGEKTLISGVYQVPAAHSAILTPGLPPVFERYWEVQYEIDYDHTAKWFEAKLRDLLEDSVKIHLRADVEIGSYVSGGVDSSLLAAMARKFSSQKNFSAFNGRFLEGNRFDESEYASALAAEQNMQLHIADIGEMDFVKNISNVIWHLDQPVAGPGAFPQYMVSKKVAEHVKVVLGGQGGDEIFGGYARYLIAYFEQCIKGAIEGTLHDGNFVVTYESIIPSLQTLRQYQPMMQEFLAEGLFGERDARYWRLVNRSNTFGSILSPGVIDHAATYSEFAQIFKGENVGSGSYFDAMTHFDFKTLLPALLQVEDRMSMAHGVEARVPFLDHPLVEFAATIPADVKFRDGELKRLLKSVFSDLLPSEIKNRKDKMGFPVPLNLWLSKGGPARDYIGDVLGSARARQRSYLNDGFTVDQVLNSQSVYGRNLWALLSLELWQNQFIDA